MKRMLMIASVASMIGQFNLDNIKLLQTMGYSVDVACNLKDRSVWEDTKIEDFQHNLKNWGINCYQIDFSRKMFDISKHVRAYKQLMAVMNRQKYEFIHCHTPMGGVIGRLAAHKKGVKVVYTAHGFHFFKGSSAISWLLFYPIEKYLSKFTDVLIVITKEDYSLACKNFKMKECRYIPGIGVDIKKISKKNCDNCSIRKTFNIPEDALVLISVGELNKNKNHEIVIRSLKKIKEPELYYLLCGIGEREDELKQLIRELHLEKNVKLLGYRKDVYTLLHSADIYIHPSYREGISVAIMEAMASGLPVICSDIRGNRDLIDDNGGRLTTPGDENAIIDAIDELVRDKGYRLTLGNHNQIKIGQFKVSVVREQMTQIYQLFK